MPDDFGLWKVEKRIARFAGEFVTHTPLFTASSAKYQSDYANDHRITFLPAAFTTLGRIDAEFLRLLFYHAHRESAEFLTTTDVYWYTNHVSSSASIHGQFYKREGTPSGTHSDPSRSMLHGALSEK